MWLGDAKGNKHGFQVVARSLRRRGPEYGKMCKNDWNGNRLHTSVILRCAGWGKSCSCQTLGKFAVRCLENDPTCTLSYCIFMIRTSKYYTHKSIIRSVVCSVQLKRVRFRHTERSLIRFTFCMDYGYQFKVSTATDLEHTDPLQWIKAVVLCIN